jgi:hypothetical protein
VTDRLQHHLLCRPALQARTAHENSDYPCYKTLSKGIGQKLPDNAVEKDNFNQIPSYYVTSAPITLCVLPVLRHSVTVTYCDEVDTG